ncbi:MAG: protease pro-enzyme activation domain-containing protein [Polyangiaceae bacterium]
MQMTRRFGWLWASAATLVLAVSCADLSHRELSPERTGTTAAALSAPPSPTINTFVVYAANNVTLGAGDHSLGGDVGVATSNGSSPQLVVGAQDGLDPAHTLFAPAISIGNLAQVGAVDTNSLTNSGGHVGTQASYPSPMPPVPSIFAATPGTTNVTVAQGQHQTLSPGTFGTLTDNGIVYLNPGTYSFASVTLGNNAQLIAQQGGSTSLLVAGAFATGTQAQILPVGQPANELTISVSGSDGPNSSPPAVAIGANSQIVSLLAAPNGTVSFGNNVQATGAYAALNCSAGSNVVMTFQSGFANATPIFSTFVAYAELSMTLGVGDHTIGGDIGVAAVGASGVGTQLTVGSQDVLDPLHTVYAPSVSIGSQAVVGDVDANTLTSSGGAFGTLEPYPAGAMPLLPLALASTPNSTNVTVPQGQQQTLSPGSFGTLTDNGIVFLNPGTYSFSSVTLGNNAQLVAQPGGTTTVAIAGTLSTGTFAQIFPAGQTAGHLSISASGNDGTNGVPPAASIGANTQIIALLNVPQGTLSFANNVQATGAFGGFFIAAGNDVTLNFQTGFLPASQQPVGQQQLSGYTTGPSTGAPLVGPVPQSTPITLAFALPVQVPTSGPYAGISLSALAQQISDPTNAMYREYISEADYAQYYSPSTTSYNNLTTFLQSAGFSVLNSYSDNELLDVTGTAGQLDQMLFAQLNYYLRPDGSQFFAPDREPSLQLSPTALPILRVAGTDNYVLPTNGAPGLGSGTNGDLQGADFRNAYLGSCATPNLNGAGQSIGLLEIGSFNFSDIEDYAQSVGIANPLITTVSFTPQSPWIALTGGPPFTTAAGQVEPPEDIELALSMAPGADIVVYQALQLEYQGINLLDDILHGMAHLLTGVPFSRQLSSSVMFSSDDGAQQSLNAMAARGQSFFQCTGDAGAFIWTSQDNRTADNITLVGGTTLVSFGNSAGAAPQESTYNDNGNANGAGGGGFFGPIPPSGLKPGTSGLGLAIPGKDIPGYQTQNNNVFISTTNKASSLYRNFPDVSIVAGNPFDFIITNSNNVGNSTFVNAGGTSASAPLWAGFMALVNQEAVALNTALPEGAGGFLNPTLYRLASGGAASTLYQICFNDVADGSFDTPQSGQPGGVSEGASETQLQISDMEIGNLGNGFGNDFPLPATGFQAVAGYDLATGLGSPTCGLIRQLTSSTPFTPVTCAAGSSICGLVCCPTTCNSGVCAPPTNFGIQASATGQVGFGPDICLSGTGFLTTNANITITGIPTDSSSFIRSAPVVNGDFFIEFPQTEGFLSQCTSTQITDLVTITAADGLGGPGTSGTTSTTIPACLWCEAQIADGTCSSVFAPGAFVCP